MMHVTTASSLITKETAEARVKRLREEVPTSPTESKETISEASKSFLSSVLGSVPIISARGAVDTGSAVNVTGHGNKMPTQEANDEGLVDSNAYGRKDTNPTGQSGGGNDKDSGNNGGDDGDDNRKDDGDDADDENDDEKGKKEKKKKSKKVRMDVEKDDEKRSKRNLAGLEKNKSERIVTAVEKSNADLIFGWVKRKVENREEIMNWAKETVVEKYEAYKEAEEIKHLKRKYKKEIKADKELQELDKQIRKMKKQLKAQRLHGDRNKKNNEFKREKEQNHLDKQTTKLKNTIHTFSHGSLNVHEYAKAMMRASARMKRMGFMMRGTDKVLAMEAAVLRNMHRMMSLQKQYSLARKHCRDVNSYMKRCKSWLDNKYADGVMHFATLNATSQAMRIMYKEVIQVQETLLPKFKDPANHSFKSKEDDEEKLPPGMTELPEIQASTGPMIISLDGDPAERKLENDRPTLKGKSRSSRKDALMKSARRKKSSSKARTTAAAWDATMKQYQSLLVIGGDDMQIIDDVSELGDSDEEIENRLTEDVIQPKKKSLVSDDGGIGMDQSKEKSSTGEQNGGNGDEMKKENNESTKKDSTGDNINAEKPPPFPDMIAINTEKSKDDQSSPNVVEAEDSEIGVESKQGKIDELLDENNIVGDVDDDDQVIENASVEAELDQHLDQALEKAVYNEGDELRGTSKDADASHNDGNTDGSVTLE